MQVQQHTVERLPEQNNEHNPPQQQQGQGQRQPAEGQRRRRRQRSWFRMRITAQNIAFVEEHKVMFLAGKTSVMDPRDQNYFWMLKNAYFPQLQVLSLTMFLLLANTIVFIVAVSIGFDRFQTFLEVDFQTLMTMGLNDAQKVRGGQIWRMFTYIFLHINLMHLISNSVILVLLVSRIEYAFGSILTLLLYIITGLAGALLSNLLERHEMLKAGASSSLYGMVGIGVGYLIINWPALEKMGFLLMFKFIFILVLIFAFLMLFTDVAAVIDFPSHFGALAAGIWISAVLPCIQPGTRQCILRGIFVFLIFAQLLACLLVFYLLPYEYPS